MTQSEFNQLSFEDKGVIVMSEGTYIGTREYYQQKVLLYSIKEFWAEVYYHPIENAITKIESLSKSDKFLSLYVKDEDLTKLLGE